MVWVDGFAVGVASKKKKKKGTQGRIGKVLTRFGFGLGLGSCVEDGWMDDGIA